MQDSRHEIIVEAVRTTGGHAVAWITGILMACASVIVPEEILPFVAKLAMAVPVGFLTALGAWAFRRLTDWAFGGPKIH